MTGGAVLFIKSGAVLRAERAAPNQKSKTTSGAPLWKSHGVGPMPNSARTCRSASLSQPVLVMKLSQFHYRTPSSVLARSARSSSETWAFADVVQNSPGTPFLGVLSQSGSNGASRVYWSNFRI